MNPYYYHKYQAFFAANDLLIAAAILGILAVIGLGTLWRAYLYSTFGILIKAYLGNGDIMIRKDAAQYCVECETIFDFGEGKLGCPCCGNRSFISVNQLLKAKKEQDDQPLPVFADRRAEILNKAARFQGMLQGADGADCNASA